MSSAMTIASLHAGPLSHLAASRQGNSVLVGGQQTLYALQLNHTPDVEGVPVFTLDKTRSFQQRGRPTSFTGVCFKPESDTFAASSTASGSLCIWDTAARESDPLKITIPAHTRNISCLAFLPSMATNVSAVAGPSIVSAAVDGTLHLWRLHADLCESQEASEESDGAGNYQAPVLSRNQLARQATPDSGYIKVDIRPNNCSRVQVRDLHVQPQSDGAQILAVQEDGFALVYDLSRTSTNHRSVTSYEVSIGKPLLSGRFHPNAPAVFAAASDQVVRVLDARLEYRKMNEICKLQTGSSNGCIRWRPDQPDQIASCGSPGLADAAAGVDAGILVWDLRRPFLPLHRLRTDGDTVYDFFWCESHFLISCGKESNVRLHSIGSADQPFSAMRCSSASWSVGRGGVDTLAVVAEWLIEAQRHSLTKAPLPVTAMAHKEMVLQRVCSMVLPRMLLQ